MNDELHKSRVYLLRALISLIVVLLVAFIYFTTKDEIIKNNSVIIFVFMVLIGGVSLEKWRKLDINKYVADKNISKKNYHVTLEINLFGNFKDIDKVLEYLYSKLGDIVKNNDVHIDVKGPINEKGEVEDV